MKTMQKKFNVLGLALTLIMVLGLIVQYFYLNNIVSKEKQKNIISAREYLADAISNKIDSYSQPVIIFANLLEANRWEEEEIEAYISQFIEGNDVIQSIYYGDINNNLIISDDWEPPSDYDLRERPWYTTAIEKDRLVISDVYKSSIDRTSIISISKPVYDENNKLMGVISSDAAVEEIVKIVEGTTIQGSGYSFLMDQSGNILAHPKYKNNAGSGIINIDSLGLNLNRKIQEKKVGQIEVKLDQVEGYLTYKPINNTDWVIANFMPLKNLQVDNSELWRMFFIALMIAIIIFVSFNSIQRRTFLIPILKLGENIKNMNLETNIGYRMPIERNDPLKDIKKTLNISLSKTQDLLEQVQSDKKEMAIHNKKLNYLSYNDQLTGLYNRRYFEQQLKVLDKEENLPLTIIMGDANGLKLINDAFGHEAGDNLLIGIASMIKQGCRAGDIVSRISGDEFVIILPKTSGEKAQLVIERIKKISKLNQVSCKQFSNIEISVSYGAGTKKSMKMDILDVLKIAEENMYRNKLFEGPNMRRRTVKMVIKELYIKDKNKESHSKAVSMVAREIGMSLGMKSDELEELAYTGEVHDIGEIGVNSVILEKAEKLNWEEKAEIRKHPEIGYRILSTLSEMSRLAVYTLAHHERYDGTGYPKGLKGEEIPLASRIIAIADAYDAMRSDRPYRKALSEDEIILEFTKNAGTQFDPALTKLFVERILKKSQDI